MSPLPKLMHNGRNPDAINPLIDKVIGDLADEFERVPTTAEVTDILIRDYPEEVDAYIQEKRWRLISQKVSQRLGGWRSSMSLMFSRGEDVPEFWETLHVWVPTAGGGMKLITECVGGDHKAIADWYEEAVVTMVKRVAFHRKLESIVGEQKTGEAVKPDWLKKEIEKAYGKGRKDDEIKKAISGVRI